MADVNPNPQFDPDKFKAIEDALPSDPEIKDKPSLQSTNKIDAVAEEVFAGVDEVQSEGPESSLKEFSAEDNTESQSKEGSEIPTPSPFPTDLPQGTIHATYIPPPETKDIL